MRRRADAYLAGAVDDGIGAHLAALEGKRRGKRLHHRAWFEGIGDRPVTQLCAREALAIVRVVGRQVDQRQNLASPGVEDDDAAGLGIMLLDRRLELAVGQVLDFRIERQAHILAVLRRLQRADILDDVAPPIADHGPAARTPEQARLEGQLDAFEPLVVDAREADDVRSHVAGRIIAAIFLFLMHAGQLQPGNPLGGFRRHLPLDENEGLVRRDLAIQFARPHVEQGGQLLFLLAGHGSRIARNRPDRLHRRRHGQHVAIAVGNLAA